MAITEYEGEAQAGKPVTESKPLRSNGSPAFRFMVHPEQWEYIEGKGWLPHIKRFSRQPGVNGVRHDNKGGDIAARTMKEEEGFQILPYVMTQDGESYMCAITNTTSGNTLHHDRWHKFKQIGNRVISVRDRDGYNAWRLWLVEEGHIEPPDRDVLHAILSAKYDNLTRTQALQHLPEVKKYRTDKKKRLDAAESAIG